MNVLALVLPLLAVPGAGNERDVDRLGWYVPDYAKLQTGGYVGSVTAGLGYAAFDDVLNIGALYGYTPAAIAGENVSSIAVTVSARPFHVAWRKLRFVPIYLGPGALFTWGDGYYQVLPDRYSSGYYPATGRHWTLHVGSEISLAPGGAGQPIERHGLYLELVALDTFLTRYLRNPETLGPEDALALALGYRLAF